MNALLYVPQDGASRGAAIALTCLRFAVAAFFAFMAVKNLTGDAHMASEFRRWGYPDWFRIATAGIQIVGALLLVSPRVSFLGSGVLACVLLGAAWTHLRHDPPAAVLSPVVFLVLVGIVAYGYRPPLLR